MAQLKITLKRSTIGEKPQTRASVRNLGLRKIGQSVVKEDRPEILGQIRAVRHLVEVEEVA